MKDKKIDYNGRDSKGYQPNPLNRPKPAAKPPLPPKHPNGDWLISSQVLGWICPVCGSGLSLSTSRCPCVPLKMEVTC